jgi:glutamate/tyrosine decarboxylase-like PLP-dependent enzyme
MNAVPPRELPAEGFAPDAVLELLRSFGRDDVDWRNGRGFSLVYDSPAWHEQLVEQATTMFSRENALSHAAFPSAARFEASVIAMVASVLAPHVPAYGIFASGGTESTMIALKAYRDHRRVETPNVVVPETAHPAFSKASAYLGLQVIEIPVGTDGCVAPDDVDAAVDGSTVAVGLSAPCYPFGTVDPVCEIAGRMAERHVGVHVDAALGGFFLPFLDRAGEEAGFALDVPGVTSVGVDLHKYGYAAKGASVLLFADADLRHAAYHVSTTWIGGAYAASGVLGTRSVGAAAGAFAALTALGQSGYRRLAADVMAVTRELQAALGEVAGLWPVGEPPMSVFAAAGEPATVHALASGLGRRGWWVDGQSRPPALHFIVFPRHTHVLGAFVDDLRAACSDLDELATPGKSGSARLPSYGVMVREDGQLTDELLRTHLDARFDG